MDNITIGEPITKQKKFYVGRAWINVSELEEGGEKKTFHSIDIKLNKTVRVNGEDNPLQSLELNHSLKIKLEPNAKRPDKNDADYNLVIIE